MPVADTVEHWIACTVPRSRRVSWYEASPRVSLEIIAALGVAHDVPVIDVGGGTSTLAAHLLASGFTDVSVLDTSAVALRNTPAGDALTLLRQDVLIWQPERQYGLWHDRAVLHFFTREKEQRAYVRALNAAVMPGGFVILATFALDGPDKCSGLPVTQYSADDLVRLVGPDYVLHVERRDVHLTPRAVRQPFTWVALERVR